MPAIFIPYKVKDKAYNKLGFSIHNYFFAKAINQVRPGGVVAFVTSRYTMDSKDSTAKLPGWRRYVYPIYTTYNGKCRKDALPIKF